MRALHAALADFIDYAGLFPPAGLDLQTTVANHDRYARSPERGCSAGWWSRCRASTRSPQMLAALAALGTGLDDRRARGCRGPPRERGGCHRPVPRSPGTAGVTVTAIEAAPAGLEAVAECRDHSWDARALRRGSAGRHARRVARRGRASGLPAQGPHRRSHGRPLPVTSVAGRAARRPARSAAAAQGHCRPAPPDSRRVSAHVRAGQSVRRDARVREPPGRRADAQTRAVAAKSTPSARWRCTIRGSSRWTTTRSAGRATRSARPRATTRARTCCARSGRARSRSLSRTCARLGGCLGIGDVRRD